MPTVPSTPKSPLFALAVFLVYSALTVPAASFVVLQVKGRVELRPAGESRWIPASPGSRLSGGDRIRTGFGSRAVLKSPDGKRRTYGSNVNVTLKAPKKEEGGVLSFFKGLAKPLIGGGDKKRSTMAAAIRANARVDADSLEVRIGDQRSRLVAGDAHEATLLGEVVKANASAVKQPDAPQQVFYNYLPVLHLPDLRLTENETRLAADAIAAYQRGNVQEAQEQLQGMKSASPRLALFRSAVNASNDQLETAAAGLNEIPSQPLGAALQAYVQALLSDHSPISIPSGDTATAALIASYLQQAAGHQSAAFESAQTATQRAPEFGAAWARLAKLAHARKDRPTAVSAIAKARALLPEEPNVRILEHLILQSASESKKPRRGNSNGFLRPGKP